MLLHQASQLTTHFLSTTFFLTSNLLPREFALISFFIQCQNFYYHNYKCMHYLIPRYLSTMNISEILNTFHLNKNWRHFCVYKLKHDFLNLHLNFIAGFGLDFVAHKNCFSFLKLVTMFHSISCISNDLWPLVQIL